MNTYTELYDIKTQHSYFVFCKVVVGLRELVDGDILGLQGNFNVYTSYFAHVRLDSMLAARKKPTGCEEARR